MAVGLKTLRPRRLMAGAALVLAVLMAHGCVADQLASYAAGLTLQDAMPERMQVAYVRTMELAPPPAIGGAAAALPAPSLPAVHQPPGHSLAVPGPGDAASAPLGAAEDGASAPPADPLPDAVATAASQVVPDAVAAAASQPDAPVLAAAAASADAAVVPATPASAPAQAASQAGPGSDPAGQPFEWPGSTRLSYTLTGNFRGEVHGQAQVEWIKADAQYQMHLDVTVGFSFAPLMSRQMSSEGDITPQGLAPRRYDQFTKMAFQDGFRAIVRFEPAAVVLSNGERRERRAGVQDTASQFVQLSWLFATQPEQLRVGHTVEVPLALPRTLSSWFYEVRDEETLYTPFGPVAAFHLVPQRVARAGGDLTTEIWIAPQLRYLPVRFRINQDGENYVDLMLKRLPELAAPATAPSASQPVLKETP